MGLKEIIEKLKGSRQEEPQEEIPDDVTRDKHLRSLRRERRIQMEEVEKEDLNEKIKEFKKARTRKYLFGIKEDLKKKIEIKKTHTNLLSDGARILKDRKKIKKTGFLGKHDL